MASARITCPDCKAVLRPAKPVPDGKKVKCPKCGNTFTTPGLIEEGLRKNAPAKKVPGKKSKAAVKKAAAPKPPPKQPVAEDDDDSGGIYSFVGANQEQEEEEEKPQIDYVPDMSIKDLRGPAQEAVVKPSNLMMLIGGLSVLSNIFLICWSFWPMVFSDSVVDWEKVLHTHYKDDKNALSRLNGYKDFKDLKEEDRAIVDAANEEAVYGFWVGGFPPMGRLWMMGVFILLLIYNAFAIMGAVKMQNLESRRWGIASSIMMLLPMGGGGLSWLFALIVAFFEQMTGFFGEETTMFYMIIMAAAPYFASLYVGVMSLRILLDQKVIDGFEYVAD